MTTPLIVINVLLGYYFVVVNDINYKYSLCLALYFHSQSYDPHSGSVPRGGLGTLSTFICQGEQHQNSLMHHLCALIAFQSTLYQSRKCDAQFY